MDVELGNKVKDKITGFIGFAVARCKYLNGCIQYEIEPETLKDGAPQKSYWIDEQRIEVLHQEETEDEYHFVGGGGIRNHPSDGKPPSLAGYEQ